MNSYNLLFQFITMKLRIQFPSQIKNKANVKFSSYIFQSEFALQLVRVCERVCQSHIYSSQVTIIPVKISLTNLRKKIEKKITVNTFGTNHMLQHIIIFLIFIFSNFPKTTGLLILRSVQLQDAYVDVCIGPGGKTHRLQVLHILQYPEGPLSSNDHDVQSEEFLN